MKTRVPAVSGYFYPAEETVLRSYLSQLFKQSREIHKRPKCLIVPHAGYEYSGIVAAAAYSMLQDYSGKIKKVLLVGPSHRISIQSICVSGADYFQTPLGIIPVNQYMRKKILNEPGVSIDDEAHRKEHCIEVQLPFLQYVLGNSFEILPVVTNSASPFQLSSIFKTLWNGSETIIVISSDLSHYLSYDEAKTKDDLTCNKIENLDYEALGDDDACGFSALRGLMYCLKEKGLHPACLDRRSSGDTGGDKSRVVGYAAFWI